MPVVLQNGTLEVYSDSSYWYRHAGYGLAWREPESPWAWEGRCSLPDPGFSDSYAAEMAGIRNALQVARHELRGLRGDVPQRVRLYSDSTCALEWQTREKEPSLKYRRVCEEAWQADAELREMGVSVKYQWVKAHRCNLGNGYADDLVRLGAEWSALGKVMEGGELIWKKNRNSLVYHKDKADVGRFGRAMLGVVTGRSWTGGGELDRRSASPELPLWWLQ